MVVSPPLENPRSIGLIYSGLPIPFRSEGECKVRFHLYPVDGAFVSFYAVENIQIDRGRVLFSAMDAKEISICCSKLNRTRIAGFEVRRSPTELAGTGFLLLLF